MPIITNPEALARLRAADDVVTAHGETVRATREELAELRRRHGQIAGVIAEHEAKRPAPDAAATGELSGMLAAKPETAASPDWIKRVRDLQAKTAEAVDAWQAEGTILAQAGAQLAGEVEALEARLETERAAHERSYAAFLTVAYDALTAEFEARWKAIGAEVLAPLQALRNPKRLYDAERVIIPFRRSINGDSSLSIIEPADTPSGRNYERLYPIEVRSGDDPIAAFRASISAPSRAGRAKPAA